MDPKFYSWKEVLDAIGSNGKNVLLHYQAPMDTRPSLVYCSRRGNGRKIRVDPRTNQADTFWADESHLDRFSW